MSKVTLDSVASGYDLSKINANFQAIEDELNNKVLYRNAPQGEPNTLETDVDANGKSIYNLPQATAITEPVTLGQLTDLFGGGTEFVDPTNLDFVPITQPVEVEGRIWYDSDEHTFAFYTDITGTSMQIGQETWVRVRNSTGSTIANGKVVYISGATGGIPTIALADADVHTADKVLGLVTADIADREDGYVTTLGIVRNLNTNAFNDGDVLYLSQTAGEVTATPPATPAAVVSIGVCVHKHASQGKILVHVNDAKAYSYADKTETVTNKTVDLADNTLTGTKAEFNAALSDADFVFSDSGFNVPPGAVLPFAMNSVPTGWLACDGAAVSRTTYADLFTAIGVVYGVGDGSTTFNVPDLRGLFIRGLGTTGTHAAAALGVLQEDQFESHTHTQYTNSGAGSGPIVGGGAFGQHNAQTAATGGTETAPANYAMLYCIKT